MGIFDGHRPLVGQDIQQVDVFPPVKLAGPFASQRDQTGQLIFVDKRNDEGGVKLVKHFLTGFPLILKEGIFLNVVDNDFLFLFGYLLNERFVCCQDQI